MANLMRGIRSGQSAERGQASRIRPNIRAAGYSRFAPRTGHGRRWPTVRSFTICPWYLCCLAGQRTEGFTGGQFPEEPTIGWLTRDGASGAGWCRVHAPLEANPGVSHGRCGCPLGVLPAFVVQRVPLTSLPDAISDRRSSFIGGILAAWVASLQSFKQLILAR